MACCAAGAGGEDAGETRGALHDELLSGASDAEADRRVGEAVEPERPAREAVGEEARREASEHAGDRVAVARLERHHQQEEVDRQGEIGQQPGAGEMQQGGRGQRGDELKEPHVPPR